MRAMEMERDEEKGESFHKSTIYLPRSFFVSTSKLVTTHILAFSEGTPGMVPGEAVNVCKNSFFIISF